MNSFFTTLFLSLIRKRLKNLFHVSSDFKCSCLLLWRKTLNNNSFLAQFHISFALLTIETSFYWVDDVIERILNYFLPSRVSSNLSKFISFNIKHAIKWEKCWKINDMRVHTQFSQPFNQLWEEALCGNWQRSRRWRKKWRCGNISLTVISYKADESFSNLCRFLSLSVVRDDVVDMRLHNNLIFLLFKLCLNR